MLKMRALDLHANGEATEASSLDKVVEEMEPSTRQKRRAAEFVIVQYAGNP